MYRKKLSPEQAEKIKSSLMPAHAMMASIFENADFNIHIRPCGQSNAFSDNRTADITLCSEFIHDMSTQRSSGTLVAVLLHEYGHSLLGKWGEPGASEEDMADQFATVMLLRSGDGGRRILQEWIQFWLKQDSRAEAVNQLRHGDTHTLSVQRARNIQNNINYPEDFTRRWNKMLYRHMTNTALQKSISQPSKSDDVDLAKDALKVKSAR